MLLFLQVQVELMLYQYVININLLKKLLFFAEIINIMNIM